VVDLFQVLDFAGSQKAPDLRQGPFALNRILEMALCRRVSSGDDDEHLSGDEQGHFGTPMIRRILNSSKDRMPLPPSIRWLI
jgi:hypothetical protein